MKTQILTKSSSFERHLHRVFDAVGIPAIHRNIGALAMEPSVVLVHGVSFGEGLGVLLATLAERTEHVVGVAADKPSLEGLLSLSRFGIRAYFNSFMAPTHYLQALTMLRTGQSWFSPNLLSRAFELARHTTVAKADTLLGELTPREREIALDVAQGYSNKRIASLRDISERTVKSHLTRIFKKLAIGDRVTLAIKLTGNVSRSATP